MKAVEDGLRRLDGVDRIQINLQTNVVTITPDSRREYDLRQFPRAIRDSGFKPGEMRIRARGVVEPGGRRFRIAGWERLVDLSPREDAIQVGALRVRGRVHYDDRLVLELESRDEP